MAGKAIVPVDDETIEELRGQLAENGYPNVSDEDILRVIVKHFDTDLHSAAIDNFIVDMADGDELEEILGEPEEEL